MSQSSQPTDSNSPKFNPGDVVVRVSKREFHNPEICVVVQWLEADQLYSILNEDHRHERCSAKELFNFDGYSEVFRKKTEGMISIVSEIMQQTRSREYPL